MQLHTHPARQGPQWVRAGFALYRQAPQVLSVNVLLMWLSLLFSGMLLAPIAKLVLPAALAPWLAQLPLALLLPGLSLGVFKACGDIARAQSSRSLRVFSGFTQHPRRLLALGALYYTCSLLALGLTTLTDDGALLAVMRDSRLLLDDKLDSAQLARSALILMALSLPIMMANWFAPVLVGLRGLSPLKAAFFSFVACWRNRGAFTLYAMTLLGVLWLGPSLIATVLTLVHPALGMVAMSLLPLLVMPLIYSSFYANALDIFPELVSDAG